MTEEQLGSLHALVAQFIGERRASNDQPIPAPFVADQILESLPHRSMMTEIEATAAYMGIAQVARAILRVNHDREYDPEQIAQHSLDLPESMLLNGGYSVLRKSDPVYVPRLRMTREDMEYVCAKFDALSAHFARHARALRADWERRNAMEPALL